MQPVMIYAVWPDAASAQECADALVSARAAACVTLIPNAKSTYRWEGRIAVSDEIVMLAKTGAAAAERARAIILDHHPYDLPCIVASNLEAALSHAPYLAWIAAETD